ncbi:MAG: hypothetical protein LJF06_03565 [Gemmatimonadetes bacterium]|nr:hypothetical protein [Gemmatimonadota bacterium]
MSDTDPDLVPRARPTPARAGAPDQEPGEENSTPTPARALFEEVQRLSPTSAPEAEERTLDAGGERWVVRVCGRTRTGSDTGPAQLLLVAFQRDGATTPERESLVVGRSLADIGEETLLTAFERGRTPSEPGTHKEIFPQPGGRRGGR